MLLTSHTFADLLDGCRGAIDGQPLQLHDISVKELRALLFALYFQCVSIHLQSYINFQHLCTNRPEDGKLVALPLDHRGGRVRYSPGYRIPQICLPRNSQMGHGNPRTHRVFQLCIHGILLLRNAVIDGRRRRAMRHSTPSLQRRRQMERARVSQEYTIRTSIASC